MAVHIIHGRQDENINTIDGCEIGDVHNIGYVHNIIYFYPYVLGTSNDLTEYLVLSDLIEILVDVTDLLGTSADTTESLIAVATNNWAAGNFYNDTL